MKKIEVLNHHQDEQLVAFLDELSKSENAVLGYHYPFYRDMLVSIEIGEPFYLGLFENEKIIAFLPGFIKKSIEGNVYSSLPFFGPNAGILTLSSNKREYSKLILDFLLQYLSENNFISASIYSSFGADIEIENEILGADFDLKVDKFTSFISLEKLTIPTKVMYDIRKATKEGVILTSEITAQKIERLYEIYQRNCKDFDIPLKPKKCIEMLCEFSKTSKNVSVYFAEYENKLIGGLIMIWSKAVASYYLPCSINEFRTFQSNSLLIHHALEEAKQRKIQIWNWESSPSTESGVYKFKKKWGSEDGNYSIFIKTLKENTFFQNLGKEKISQLFPNYFVFPFQKLNV